jgi:hypothetical protein
MKELSESTFDYTEKTYTPYVGSTYPAADGSASSIYILGYMRETISFIVIDVNFSGVPLDSTLKPRILDAFKASYRYILR